MKKTLFVLLLVCSTFCAKAQIANYVRVFPEANYLLKLDTTKIFIGVFFQKPVYNIFSGFELYSKEEEKKQKLLLKKGEVLTMKDTTINGVKYIALTFKKIVSHSCRGIEEPCIREQYINEKAMFCLQKAFVQKGVNIPLKNKNKLILKKAIYDFMNYSEYGSKLDTPIVLLSGLGISLEYFMSLL